MKIDDFIVHLEDEYEDIKPGKSYINQYP